MNESQTSLQLGIAAYKAGEKEKARAYLLKAVREQPESEQAWGWLSNTTANSEERIHCLRQVVRINPGNAAAANKLKELESQEWLQAAPAVSTPAAVPASLRAPQPSAGARAGSETVQTVLVVLLVLLVLFWLGVGFLQLAFSLTETYDLTVLCFGAGNIVFSIINGFMIAPVARRKKNMLQPLYALAIIGTTLGMFQLVVNAAYLQSCAIPLYVLLGILAYVNRDLFVS